MPNGADISRIIGNVEALIRGFYRHEDATALPADLLWYENVNTVEKNLRLIYELLERLVGSFKYSGTFYSGSTVVLPVRR